MFSATLAKKAAFAGVAGLGGLAAYSAAQKKPLLGARSGSLLVRDIPLPVARAGPRAAPSATPPPLQPSCASGVRSALAELLR